MEIQPINSAEGLHCSFPIAQKLKKLGVEQSSYYFLINTGETIIPAAGQMIEIILSTSPDSEVVAAFSSDQLIKMLGSVASSINMKEDGAVFFTVHYKDPFDGNMLTHSDKTLPDALAGMLLLLIEGRKKPLDEANRWLVM